MYWPKEGTETYGSVQVTLIKEDIMAMYTVRTLEISHLRVSSFFHLLFSHFKFPSLKIYRFRG